MLSMLSILDTLMKSNTTESHIIDWVKYSSSSTGIFIYIFLLDCS